MTTTSTPLLEVRNVHLWRGDRHLLRGVSFVLSSGEFLQLVGPNGVGKTSLLRVVCGLLPPESGEILWRGANTHTTSQIFHSELGYLAHANALKGDLTPRENIHFELGLRREIDAAHIGAQLEAVGLAHCADIPARSLSAGQRRRVALARLALSASTLWVMDEPTTNLDVDGIALVEKLMAEHLQRGGAILAAAHHSLLVGHGPRRTLELQP